MATLSIVATAEPSSTAPGVSGSGVPPRIRLNITDTGTPAINSVTVTRLDATGRTSTVRTVDGAPLVLTTSGSTRIGTLYDYEMPYGETVTYSTVQQPSLATTATVTSDYPWLVHPGVPALSMPVEFRIGSFESVGFTVNSGIFHPMGRRNAIVITDGQRRGGTGSFTVGTSTLSEVGALMSLLDDAGVLLLNAPLSLGLGIDTQYIAVQDVTVRRLSDIGSDPRRDVVMPYVVVDAPVGGSQSTWTWADATAPYASWTALMAGEATWAAVLAPTN